MTKSSFLQRLGTGVLFFIVVIGASIFNPLSFGALWLVATVLGLLEFYKLVKSGGVYPQVFSGIVAGALLFITNFLFVKSEFNDWPLLLLNLPMIFSLFIIEVFRSKSHPFSNIAFTLLGVVYVALPFSLLNYLVIDLSVMPSYKFSPWVLIGMFMTLWANDSWAYLWGSWFGKHKLYPSVSPGKTWEGFIGGFFTCLLWAWLMSLFIKDIGLIDWLALASILSLVGTVGDLAESKLKRSLNIKDSGNILPGHGGILDRFDALILATPFVVVYFYLSQYLVS
jgi:phosphatidate cytidylyltransferase